MQSQEASSSASYRASSNPASRMSSGNLPYLYFPTPMVPGARAIGRIAATGPDTTSFQVDQLVLLDPFIRARDNPDVQILWGAGVCGGNPAAHKLIEGPWRNGMYAEYARAPLENCYALNEAVLMRSPSNGGLGYSVGDLSLLTRHTVPYGGFRAIDLKAGETVIVAPATGIYSGAAVEVASAMGARVIAVGRNLETLQKVAAHLPRVQVVEFKGDFNEDLAALKKFGTIDAYMDLSPIAANESTHIRSCMMAVKQYGRVSLIGVNMKDIAIPYAVAVAQNLTIRGQYMYEREDVWGLIKLAESGLLKLGAAAGHELVGEFGLEDHEKAFDVAQQNPEAGKKVLLTL
ncbi:related to ADH3-alcohol dehydrogenase III [Phialocephala subalpina]|uniref:Related to ADH3-alcohol dehydrogenase III n=1 Tax=Phialocephala subalpina TaxID=576137 RepID=A0A1L7XSD1_9HELO|nr:related to ADH3-alcohol dehydrogenase III [Phialocephala subalpina]